MYKLFNSQYLRTILILTLILTVITELSFAQNINEGRLTIARLKYSGGGDWYNDPSAVPNLLSYIEKETGIFVRNDEVKISLSDEKLFSFPILFITGHGRIRLTEVEVRRLREYLTHGGFLYADDDYGMDKFFRTEMKKVFPDYEFVELPFNHEIYRTHFEFTNGPPKIHEHDGGPPRAYGLFYDGQMVVYYTVNTNISDGWVDPAVHKDPPQIREAALKMGTNIILWVLMH